MNHLEELEKKIEEMRLYMYSLYNQDPLDKKLIEASQVLDRLLNELSSAHKSASCE
ncbi:Spo0E family sporulation regulatory protein-aspartic acid phosphatase [Thalassobacillus devorans]|uniref:Spo0E family sporulation regulatory protein-aspartic acid phosphatase n=1 Tax=Thalassobacillus devorans TaxID=279813 RepID=UPI0004B3E0E7|nr:Spo0E family sporulation regulatory protein-aspartic acid phosphatase [Thalassobacillus devorans]